MRPTDYLPIMAAARVLLVPVVLVLAFMDPGPLAHAAVALAGVCAFEIAIVAGYIWSEKRRRR